MARWLRRLLKNERGQALAEYHVLIPGSILMVLATFMLIVDPLKGMSSRVRRDWAASALLLNGVLPGHATTPTRPATRAIAVPTRATRRNGLGRGVGDFLFFLDCMPAFYPVRGGRGHPETAACVGLRDGGAERSEGCGRTGL